MLEFLLDVLLEVSMGAVTEKKIPKWIRISAGIFLLLFFVLFFCSLVWLCTDLFQKGKTAGGCILLGIIVLSGISGLYILVKKK